jgi:DNA invertase Pin-like site-specific DNA recombinase
MRKSASALTTSTISTTAVAARRAAIYCRISSDQFGTELGVTRQREDGETLCRQRGWNIVDAFVDNDVSATKGVHRQRYEEMLQAVEGGLVDVVVVWHLSRLWRNSRQRAEGIERLKARGIEIVSVKGPSLDLSSAYGRGMAEIMGAFDTMESEIKSERMIREAQQAAEDGKARRGGTRPFGYAQDRVTVIEEEAAVVREAAHRVLSGESLRSVVADLNGRSVLTPRGNRWTTQGLRQILASARISGRREYRPTNSYAGSARPLLGEITAVAEWPGIITVEQSDRLRALLTDKSRRTVPAQARKTMLTGILRCGHCGQPMVSRPRRQVPRYTCNSDRGGCGKTTLDGARADAHVRDVVVQSLADSPNFVERLHRPESDGPDLSAQLRADEERLEHLAADYGAGDITRAEWKAARSVIQARVEVARARMARFTGTTALASFVGPYEEMLTTWNERMNASQRRAVVQAVTEQIDVAPRKKAGVFDPARIQPVWRR